MQLYFKTAWPPLNTAVDIYCLALMKQDQKINTERANPWHCDSDLLMCFRGPGSLSRAGVRVFILGSIHRATEISGTHSPLDEHTQPRVTLWMRQWKLREK